MATRTSPLAGQPAIAASLIEVAKLVAAYCTEVPDPSVPAQRVAFGTSGHRGSAFDGSFNEAHVLAITQAICDFRRSQRITGPLFLGTDTHALSQPACATALEVLAGNDVDVMLAAGDETTPTPAISHAIVVHNRVHTRVFMTLDWDGQIRMDPSSPYAMQRLQGMKDRFDIDLARDTDHDRHGIVTPGAGLLAPNHCLSVAIDYLFAHRPAWGAQAAVGKTVVSTRLIDRVAARHGRQLFEVPVGFKWFAAGLHDGSLGFCGEESAGASFLRRDGSVWTTDKDGIIAALLSAEITAKMGRDPGVLYADLANEFGNPVAERVEAPASPGQKARLAALSPQRVASTALAGEKIQSILSHAPGNGAPIGGIKVSAASGWFAARPSGTEDIYKIYAESFAGPQHLQRVLEEAQGIVDAAISNPCGSGAG